jgi:hypothetical protein
MRVLVCGGREYDDFGRVCHVLDAIKATRLAHGACGWDADNPSSCVPEKLRGADGLADAWARKREVGLELWPAHWGSLGNRAGPVRNFKMLKEFVPAIVIAFPGDRGTADMIGKAKRAGVTVLRVEY